MGNRTWMCHFPGLRLAFFSCAAVFVDFAIDSAGGRINYEFMFFAFQKCGVIRADWFSLQLLDLGVFIQNGNSRTSFCLPCCSGTLLDSFSLLLELSGFIARCPIPIFVTHGSI